MSIEEKLGANRMALIEEYDIGGLSYKQIANEYNIPIGTVKSRIHRGRKMIKAMGDDD